MNTLNTAGSAVSCISNKQTIHIVDAPTVALADGEKAGDLLLQFYYKLGWNGNDILDPMKVRTTKEVYDGLYDQILGYCPGAVVAVGMLMVNSGPGVDDYVPPGKVYLLEGWTRPAVTEPEGGEIHVA